MIAVGRLPGTPCRRSRGASRGRGHAEALRHLHGLVERAEGERDLVAVRARRDADVGTEGAAERLAEPLRALDLIRVRRPTGDARRDDPVALRTRPSLRLTHAPAVSDGA